MDSNPLYKVKRSNSSAVKTRSCDTEQAGCNLTLVQLAEIKAPTLVMGGEEDKFYLNHETVAGIPNVKLIFYEGFGHNAFDDNKRQLQIDILAFLKANT